MTRRKDKMKQKQELVRKTQIKSRVFQKQIELIKETNILENIQGLPPELIRIIYEYLSGNAKIICNFKFNFLEKIAPTFRIYDNVDIIDELSIEQLSILCSKGFLKKYPDIVDEFNDHIRIWYTPENHKHVKTGTKYACYRYITNIIRIYSKNKNKLKKQKNWVFTGGNTLFLDLDKAFYLYKCLENLDNRLLD
jgi:hypothetical protein